MNCSFIIPAYNEEAYLPKTIESLRQSILQSGIIETGEIIVVDNDSTDQTAEIAKELGVTVVKEPMRQIARARNSGAWHAKGEILFFIDADTDVASEHISQAYNLMVQKKAFGGGAHAVMIGGMLAGHDESEQEVNDGKIEFYGMSSDRAREKHGKRKTDIEETKVDG